MKMTVANHIDLLFRFDRGLKLRESIFEAVKEGDCVVDAGCGTGLLSLWSVQAGAKRVLAIDKEDLAIARRLAEDNGYIDRIEFMDSDLANVREKQNGRWDALIAMTYFNDPRRDEQQSVLTYNLRRHMLVEGGQQIPDKVEYSAYAAEWNSQDIGAKMADVDRKIKMMEERYGLILRSLSEIAKTVPDPKWFPVRNNSGLLERPDAHILSSKIFFATVDYTKPFEGYPDRIAFQIERSGVFNVVVFLQNLYYKDKLLFANESVSWIGNPRQFNVDSQAEVCIDNVWRRTNMLSLKPS